MDFQLGFPFKSTVGYIGVGERLITCGMKGKKVYYIELRMADEIADPAKCFLLACALKYGGTHHRMWIQSFGCI